MTASTFQYQYTIHTPLMDEVMGGFRAEFSSNQLFTAEDILGGEEPENLSSVPDEPLFNGLT